MLPLKPTACVLFGSAVFGLVAFTPVARAQSMSVEKGYGAPAGAEMRSTEPRSNRASNIVADDTRSAIAPALPPPPVGDNAAPLDYLRAAHDALMAGHTGQAQESLEMAETRELTRETTPDAAALPDGRPRIAAIRDALHALGRGDRGGALNIIDAMAN